MLKIVSKKSALCMLNIFSILLLFASFSHAFPATVVKITDGDTLTVENMDGERSKIRLYGIDCPEKEQPFGSEATEKARYFADLKNIDLEIINVDRYGRTVGIVTLPDGTMLQDVLLSSGLAWVYPEYCDRKEVCDRWQDLERSASEKRMGLWQSQKSVAPWDWRKGKR